jgi:hypothetical protein
MSTEARKPGWLITISALVFLVWMGLLYPLGVDRSTELLRMGAHLWGIGLLFLLAYYFEAEALIFRWLIWVCEHLSWPSSRKMAFFYFSLAAILGSIALLEGLGVVRGIFSAP